MELALSEDLRWLLYSKHKSKLLGAKEAITEETL